MNRYVHDDKKIQNWDYAYVFNEVQKFIDYIKSHYHMNL